METEIDYCLCSDFDGGLRRAVDPPRTQMPGSGGCATVEPAPIAFSDICWLRDAGDFAASRSHPHGKTGRTEAFGVRLRAVCYPANSEPNSVHVE